MTRSLPRNKVALKKNSTPSKNIVIKKELQETFAAAEKAFDSFEYEEAARIARNVLQELILFDEHYIACSQLVSAALLESGQLTEAHAHMKAFLERLNQEVQAGSKFSLVLVQTSFSLAQLSLGKEAETYYLQGLKYLEETSNTASFEFLNKEETQNLCASGWASLAEIYMTDLCEEENAEAKCREAVSRSLATNELSLESQRMAMELSLVLGEKELALEHASCLKQILCLSQKEMEDANHDYECDDDDISEEQITNHSFEARLAISRTFIELGMYDEALELLSKLLQEDEECPDLWYLSGLACELNRDVEDSVEMANSGLSLCAKLDQLQVPVDPELRSELERMSRLQ